MNCKNCGNPIDGEKSACSVCGAKIHNHDILPLKWHRFLVAVFLIVGAAVNLFNGIRLIFLNYPADTALHHEGARILDVIVGFGMLLLTILGVHVRFRLSGYYKDGPKRLALLEGSSLIINLVYSVAAYAMLGHIALSFVCHILLDGAMLFINTRYFKRREHMFIN